MALSLLDSVLLLVALLSVGTAAVSLLHVRIFRHKNELLDEILRETEANLERSLRILMYTAHESSTVVDRKLPYVMQREWRRAPRCGCTRQFRCLPCLRGRRDQGEELAVWLSSQLRGIISSQRSSELGH